MADTPLKEYLGIAIVVTDKGKFAVSMPVAEPRYPGHAQRIERANLAAIEKVIRDARTVLQEPIPAVYIDELGYVEPYGIIGWDAKVHRFIVRARYGDRRTIERYHPLVRPDPEKAAQMQALTKEIERLTKERKVLRESFVPFTLEDLVAAGTPVPEVGGE